MWGLDWCHSLSSLSAIVVLLIVDPSGPARSVILLSHSKITERILLAQEDKHKVERSALVKAFAGCTTHSTFAGCRWGDLNVHLAYMTCSVMPMNKSGFYPSDIKSPTSEKWSDWLDWWELRTKNIWELTAGVFSDHATSRPLESASGEDGIPLRNSNQQERSTLTNHGLGCMQQEFYS